ncbi:hypothetical protein GOODEAATRI_020364 [Goodea atripinnis]|uniref:Uncharacterized protein n=1 Tax=Goodea atripinnis TaxID=208336 RepID=A0ABV0MTQ0_9TELE
MICMRCKFHLNVGLYGEVVSLAEKWITSSNRAAVAQLRSFQLPLSCFCFLEWSAAVWIRAAQRFSKSCTPKPTRSPSPVPIGLSLKTFKDKQFTQGVNCCKVPREMIQGCRVGVRKIKSEATSSV